ncbi:MAG TPA: tRNA pseudouridine(55) synthase TruB [Burkholderiales bacterium]
MIDGALLLDKPVGPTSNAVLQRAKRLLGAVKAGHAGTLDPLASGLLIVLFGEATKFAGPALEADKEYLASVKLGVRTSTGDAEGEVLATELAMVEEPELRETLGQFLGEIQQVPPMHSALKRDGVPLYQHARRGETVERLPRRVLISRLELIRYAVPLVELRVRCSKGTYVRTLAEDIGAKLGCGAHLAGLRRTAAGAFRVEQAHTLDALQEMTTAARQRALLPLAALLADLPRAELDATAADRLRQGQVLKMDGLGPGLHGVFGPGGEVIGLGRAESGGVLKALRLTQAAEKQVKSRA